jgi:hypothetical protein
VLLAAGRLLDDHGIGLADVGVRRPSLDDVFLAFTGHGVESGDETDASTRVSS